MFNNDSTFEQNFILKDAKMCQTLQQAYFHAMHTNPGQNPPMTKHPHDQTPLFLHRQGNTPPPYEFC